MGLIERLGLAAGDITRAAACEILGEAAAKAPAVAVILADEHAWSRGAAELHLELGELVNRLRGLGAPVHAAMVRPPMLVLDLGSHAQPAELRLSAWRIDSRIQRLEWRCNRPEEDVVWLAGLVSGIIFQQLVRLDAPQPAPAAMDDGRIYCDLKGGSGPSGINHAPILDWFRVKSLRIGSKGVTITVSPEPELLRMRSAAGAWSPETVRSWRG
ncbi:MAG: hypothetical protein GMKNLPBB_02767 [Myxococcota bacterium]|nr:hypothetical protein [Myxococcota bacterium]